MYLIVVEGGDGTGKGTSARMLRELAEQEFSFPDVWLTEEPRRDSELGRLAVAAVQEQGSPEREAALFAADRLAHGHLEILPRLAAGQLVISERSVPSSLVYQGLLGGLGVERVAAMNAAAARPDLTIWLDCDPSVALRRIEQETLRGHVGKREYFETSELQIQLRAGYRRLLADEGAAMPDPFDRGRVVGPVSNEGGVRQLRTQLRWHLRRFLHRSPPPLNATAEAVDLRLLEGLAGLPQGQQRLIDAAPAAARPWLAGAAPQERLASLLGVWAEQAAGLADVPTLPLHRSVAAVLGTLDLVGPREVSGLRASLGPVRNVTARHTQRLLRFMQDQGLLRVRGGGARGGDPSHYAVEREHAGQGRLLLALWPLLPALATQVRRHERVPDRTAMAHLLQRADRAPDVLARLAVLGPGRSGEAPTTIPELLDWWSTSDDGET